MRFSRLLARRPKQKKPVHASKSNISKWSDAYAARQFSSATKTYVSRGFRCSPKATDKPNVAVNACQNFSPDTEFTLQSRLAKIACEYAYWPLTTAKVDILLYKSCWQSRTSDSTGIKLSFDVSVRKAVKSRYTSNQGTRRQFTFDDKNSTFDRENRVKTLTFTAKCWQTALRDDNASFSVKLR